MFLNMRNLRYQAAVQKHSPVQGSDLRKVKSTSSAMWATKQHPGRSHFRSGIRFKDTPSTQPHTLNTAPPGHLLAWEAWDHV